MEYETEQQLLYITIQEFVPQKASISIKFKYAHGARKESDHCYSRDKDKYAHCYRKLEEGQTYIIVESKSSRGRWIWEEARLVTVAQAQHVHKMCGFHPTREKFKEAVEWLNTVQFPKKKAPPKMSDDLLDLVIF